MTEDRTEHKVKAAEAELVWLFVLTVDPTLPIMQLEHPSQSIIL